MMGSKKECDGEDVWLSKPTVLVGNKADVPGALDRFQELESAFGAKYPVVMVSAEEAVGLDDLAEEVFTALKVMRVYTKSPREKIKEFERKDPLVLPLGSTVSRAAEQLHRDMGRGLRYAVLWGSSGKFEAQRVGTGHELIDGDVIELHT